MEKLQTSIKSLKTNLLTLVDKHKDCLERLDREMETNMQQQSEINMLKEEIKDLESKNKILKIAGKSVDEEDNREMKLKINELVREVDKCIAQFNK